MKIAMVSPYSWAHPGGVNNHIRGLCREMMRRGHSVTVIAPDEGEVPEGAAFTTAGRSVPVPANGSIARIALMPGTARRVGRAVRQGVFDVVHVHEPMVPFASTAAVKAAPNLVVGTFHAAGEGRSVVYGMGRLMFGGVHRRLDRLIAVSETAKRVAGAHFPGRYVVIPNGVDTGVFRPVEGRPAGFPRPGTRVVLFVGRKEKRKGLRVLLRAFPRVLDAIPNCALLIVGEGYDSEGVLKDVPAGLGRAVTVPGYVPYEDLPRYYSAADVFCAPALGGESFGIVLLEAMACGTAVVASDIPGYRDVVEATGGGRLFRAGDPGALASTLTELLGGDEERRRIASRGVASVRDYSWRALGDRIESCYAGD